LICKQNGLKTNTQASKGFPSYTDDDGRVLGTQSGGKGFHFLTILLRVD
jgi:hypothetical protein